MCQRKWASLRGGGFSPQNDGFIRGPYLEDGLPVDVTG